MADRRIVLAISGGIGLMAVAGWWAWGWQRDAIGPGNPSQIALGQQLYARHCAECHGANLEGEAEWRVRRPSGELPAPPHDASGHTWHHSDEQLFAITKHGIARFAPPDYKSAMPSFVGRLTDAEIRAVLAFIKSTWPEEICTRQGRLNRR